MRVLLSVPRANRPRNHRPVEERRSTDQHGRRLTRRRHHLRRVNPNSPQTQPLGHVGLYTILPSPIWHGVWHQGGGAVGCHILRNGRAMVLQ